MEEVLKRLETYTPDKLLTSNYSLEAIKKFLDFIGNPQKKINYIHVGGTSGKGSTTRFISSILESQGYKVGSFYSPHVYTILERIQLNRNNIPLSDFVDTFNKVDEDVQRFVLETGVRSLTYFEILFAVSICYFVEQGVDIAVIEVGFGGKLDATNVIDSKFAVLTNVSLDHTNILGSTVEEILNDKKYIIKTNSVVVSGIGQEKLNKIVRVFAGLKKAEVINVNDDVQFQIIKESLSRFVFNYQYKDIDISELSIVLAGRHQVLNAVLAMTVAIEYLRRNKKQIDFDNLKKYISEVKLPGRIEVRGESPLVIWDAAHNKEKMRALTEVLEQETNGNINLLFAVKKGQDIKSILSSWKNLNTRTNKVFLTTYRTAQDVKVESEKMENYMELFRGVFKDSEINIQPDAVTAYRDLLKNATEDSLVVVTGSFYLLSFLSEQGV